MILTVFTAQNINYQSSNITAFLVFTCKYTFSSLTSEYTFGYIKNLIFFCTLIAFLAHLQVTMETVAMWIRRGWALWSISMYQWSAVSPPLALPLHTPRSMTLSTSWTTRAESRQCLTTLHNLLSLHAQQVRRQTFPHL